MSILFAQPILGTIEIMPSSVFHVESQDSQSSRLLLKDGRAVGVLGSRESVMKRLALRDWGSQTNQQET